MTIYAVDPPDEYPENIIRWSVREVLCCGSEERTRHLVGYIPLLRSGRASTSIQAFDRERMRISTSSGRVYQLEGQPGITSDAEYVWKYWKSANEANDEIDVSDQYC
ncbi:hypothetical protein [Methylobacter sp.]|uniref:hypothetical protein n=1 Tax=Methylobacter sp. TaxID=2051955 RepID=UPI002FDDCADF